MCTPGVPPVVLFLPFLRLLFSSSFFGRNRDEEKTHGRDGHGTSLGDYNFPLPFSGLDIII
jgi:hypothetical protein